MIPAFDLMKIELAIAEITNGFAEITNGFAEITNGFTEITNGFAEIINLQSQAYCNITLVSEPMLLIISDSNETHIKISLPSGFKPLKALVVASFKLIVPINAIAH